MSEPFEELYADAAGGRAVIPWDRDAPTPLVRAWVEDRPAPAGATAVVVGCGYGRDAELVGGHGYRTVGFDVSPTAIDTARERHPDSEVDYRVADLLALPVEWIGGFDLVVESMNVQALTDNTRRGATTGVSSLVAPGGTLLVIEVARDDGALVEGPPWPLDRSEIEAFGAGLEARSIERLVDDNDPAISRWVAEFVRVAD